LGTMPYLNGSPASSIFNVRVFIELESANDAALGFVGEVLRELSSFRLIVQPDGSAGVAGHHDEFFPAWIIGHH